ncbi:kinase-like domain-containing protein [Immersiella caudata]|uniref:EKC/KEOPS complex subunit BUD32 n=1 Tax=Immersiella caudata TaxID=314043 RepID=A0AA40C480_9PEZI|nr:kinase-like domain-containing protein [Immersiella caudata]
MSDVEELGEYYEIVFPAPVENPNLYHPGGFHPVRLGEILDSEGRFRVVHKLGDGGFGTVWLCRDSLHNKWRAVKINAAKASEESCPDLAIMEQFSAFTPEQLAENHIALPSEYFWLDGPNGRHLCTVMPLLGSRLNELYKWYGNCPPLLKRICFQLAQGLGFLHDHGYCHGDFRPDNILFQLADGIDELPEDELLETLGQPQQVKVIPFCGGEVGPHVPEYLVSKTSFTFSSGLCSNKIVISDLGLSYPIGGTTKPGIPLFWSAPEDLFARGELGPATDIWALGCTIMEVATGLLPFKDENGVILQTVQMMEETMGPLPQPYRDAWEVEFELPYANDKLDDSLNVTMTPEFYQYMEKLRLESHGIAHLLRGQLVKGCFRLFVSHEQARQIACQDYCRTGRLPGFTPLDEPAEWDDRVGYERNEEDMELLHDLLSKIFRWHPEERASLDEILDHPWLEVWFNCKEHHHSPACPIRFSTLIL